MTIKEEESPDHIKSLHCCAGFLCGSEGGNRTRDPRLMSPLLYQLSYLAICFRPI